MQRRRDALPFRVQELATERIWWRICHRMDQPVQAIPFLACLFHCRSDVIRFADVQLEKVRDWIQLLGRHLSDAHTPSEAGQPQFRAGLLRLARDRVADGAPAAHSCEDASLSLK